LVIHVAFRGGPATPLIWEGKTSVAEFATYQDFGCRLVAVAAHFDQSVGGGGG
jgi:hypothetical protein